MHARRSVHEKKSLVKPLSYKETALQALAPSLMILIGGLYLPIHVKTYFDHQGALDTLVQGGRTLSSELGWILPVIITVLVGFLAAALAGNSYVDAVEADRLRRTLGSIGLLVGTAGVLVGIYVGIYATMSDNWALFVGLVPAIVIIVFLSLHVGRYVALSNEEKLKYLQAVMTSRKMRMSTLEKRALSPWWIALLTSSVVIPMAAAATALAMNPALAFSGFLTFLVAGFMACVATLVIGRFTLVAVYTDLSKFRFITGIVPLLIYLTLMLVTVVAIWQGIGYWAGTGSMILGGGALVIHIFPRKYQPQSLLNLTVDGSAAASAHRKFAVIEAKNIVERNHLVQALAQEKRRNWPERIMAALQMLFDSPKN